MRCIKVRLPPSKGYCKTDDELTTLVYKGMYYILKILNEIKLLLHLLLQDEMLIIQATS